MVNAMEENRNQTNNHTNNQTDDAQLMRDHPFDEPPMDNLPEIKPEEERIILTKRELMKMIIGGYISMLPIFLAFVLAFIVILLLFG